MKTTLRIRVASVTTAAILLLTAMSPMSLSFAEATSQAVTQKTSQATAREASQAAVEETSQVPVQIVPGSSKPFAWQHTPMVAKIASIINMTVEDLIAVRNEGKSFMEIAAEKGISERQLLDALTKDLKTFLDTRVAEGKLTSEQAAANISEIEENLKLALSRKEIGPPEAKPNTGMGIGRKNVSRMQPAHGRAMINGKRVFMRGFSQGFQAGRRVGLRQGYGFGQNQGQGQGVCPFCGQTCPFGGQTQTPTN
jgi:uncharacterized protein (DUF433 family)